MVGDFKMELERIFEANLGGMPEKVNQLIYTVFIAHEEGDVTEEHLMRYLNRFESFGHDVSLYRRYLETKK